MTAPAVSIIQPPDIRRLHVAAFESGMPTGYSFSKADNGNVVVNDFKIFRSGSFKDSWGELTTWDASHMTQMVTNFDTLKANGILPNVPVREGHRSIFGGGGAVKGYFQSLSTVNGQDPQGEDCVFLLCNFEFTEPDGAEKFARGTYRARSAEVGMYESNAGASYYPVMMGFAFVDIPAVEGLDDKVYQAPQGFPGFYENESTHKQFTVIVPKEYSMTAGGGSTQEGQQTQTGQGGGAPTPPAQGGAPEGQQQHAAPAPQAHQFSINGQPTTDYAAVQRHIDTLQGTVDEHKKTARSDFVTSLASGPHPRILATELDNTLAFAQRLSDEDYDAWKATFSAAAQPLGLLGNHGNGNSTPDTNNSGTVDPKADRIAVLRGIVKNHERSGLKPAQVQATDSYKELQTLLSSSS